MAHPTPKPLADIHPDLAKAPVEGTAGKVDGEVLVSLADRRNDYKNQAQGLTGYVPKLVAELEQGVTTTYDAVMQGKLPPRQTPETVLAGLKGLDADSLAFAQTALRLAQQGQIQAEAVKTVLERLETDRAAAAAGTGPTEQFESALAVAAKALPTQQARLAFASDYLRLRTGAPSGNEACHPPPSAATLRPTPAPLCGWISYPSPPEIGDDPRPSPSAPRSSAPSSPRGAGMRSSLALLEMCGLWVPKVSPCLVFSY